MPLPSKYDPKFCELIIEEMAQGKSMMAFAGEQRVARSTLQKWSEAHPAFKEAIAQGKEACAAWWELRGRETAKTNKGNATMITFGLKNMAQAEWQDKKSVETTGKGGGPIETVTTVEYRIVDAD